MSLLPHAAHKAIAAANGGGIKGTFPQSDRCACVPSCGKCKCMVALHTYDTVSKCILFVPRTDDGWCAPKLRQSKNTVMNMIGYGLPSCPRVDYVTEEQGGLPRKLGRGGAERE